jgi:TonB family protein
VAPPRRLAGRKRGPGAGLRPGVVLSALLHLGFAALVVLASLGREKPPEPLPPPSYAVEFEGGAPDRPAERASESSPPLEAEAVPQEATPPPEPPVAAVEPPAPEAVQAPPETPPAAPAPSEAPATTAEAEPPSPEDLPVPPPPAPPRPQREAALTAPPRPARPPPPSDPLPGLYMPDARSLQPPRPPGPRRGLDLSPGQPSRPGRDTPEPEASVRGAQVGPDWRNALRQWWEDHKRYPEGAAVLGEEGTTRVELIVDPDGRVRSAKLLRRSGSVWLDAGTMSLFRNAKLPPFPAGADPTGVVIDWTINYRIIR